MRRHLLLPALLLLFLPTACARSEVVAMVNDQAILRSEYDRRLATAQADMELAGQAPADWQSEAGRQTLATLREQVLQTMIDERLIAQAAEAAGLSVDPAIVEEIVEQRRQMVQAIGFPDLETYLEERRMTLEEYRTEIGRDLLQDRAIEELVPLPDALEQVHLRHILLLTPEDAQAALERLDRGEGFAQVAEDLSTDRTSPGGDLGWLPSEVLPEGLAGPSAQMSPGEVRILQTEYGYHVVELLETSHGPIRPEVLNRPAVVRMLKENRFAAWLEGLHQVAQIEVRLWED